MNRFKAALLLAAVVSGSVLAGTGDAHGRGRAHVGIWFGVPAPLFVAPYHYYPHYYPYYYPRYYYPAPVVVPAPAAPPVYIEQSPPAAAAPSSPTQGSGAYWYYCRDSQTYYPYVQQCASPWQQVVPQSAPPS